MSCGAKSLPLTLVLLEWMEVGITCISERKLAVYRLCGEGTAGELPLKPLPDLSLAPNLVQSTSVDRK